MSDITTSTTIRNKIGWLIGTAAAFLIFVIIGTYSVRVTSNYTGYDQKRTMDRYATLAKVRDEANKTLTTADWIDQGKQIVRIPIDEAMAKEVETLKTKSAVIGAEIPGTAPALAPAPTSAPATNAAPTATPPPAKEKK